MVKYITSRPIYYQEPDASENKATLPKCNKMLADIVTAVVCTGNSNCRVGCKNSPGLVRLH